MISVRNLFIGFGLGGIALVGCAPSEDKQASPEQPAAQAAAPAAAPAPTPSAPVAVIETAAAPAAPEAAPAAAEGGEGGAIDHSITDASAPFGDDNLVKDLAPAGWKQVGPIEHYNVAALYNKINGRSELYMAYDVLGLSWVSFVEEGNNDNFVDLFVYDMRTPKNGFGIYSVERDPGQAASDLGRLSYQTGSNFYFWKGNHYGYVNASRTNDDNSKAAHDVAAGLMPRLTDSDEKIEGLDWLPQEGLIQDTIQYFKADALSLDFLTDTFAGQYQVGDKKYRAFVSRRKDDSEAAGIITAFGKYSADYAEKHETATVDGVEVSVADWGGVFDGVFHVGATVAGVSNVEGRDNANAALSTLIAQIKTQQK